MRYLYYIAYHAADQTTVPWRESMSNQRKPLHVDTRPRGLHRKDRVIPDFHVAVYGPALSLATSRS